MPGPAPWVFPRNGIGERFPLSKKRCQFQGLLGPHQVPSCDGRGPDHEQNRIAAPFAFLARNPARAMSPPRVKSSSSPRAAAAPTNELPSKTSVRTLPQPSVLFPISAQEVSWRVAKGAPFPFPRRRGRKAENRPNRKTGLDPSPAHGSANISVLNQRTFPSFISLFQTFSFNFQRTAGPGSWPRSQFSIPGKANPPARHGKSLSGLAFTYGKPVFFPQRASSWPA